MTDLEPLVTALTGVRWTPRIRNVTAQNLGVMVETASPLGRRIVSVSPAEDLGRWEQWRAELLKVIAEMNGCSARVHTQGVYHRGKRRRYWVTIYGFEADIERAVELHRILSQWAIDHIATFVGENLTHRRRLYLNHFAAMIETRLGDVTSRREWVARHQARADAARQRAGCETLHIDTVRGGV